MARPAVYLGGVDEAGYGPLLGPLVVGYALFEAPRPDLDLWSALAPGVARAGAGARGEVLVDDSKRVFRGRGTRRRLERSVSAFARLAGAGGAAEPPRLADWLARPPAPAKPRLRAAAWYRDLAGPLCPAVDPSQAVLDAARLRCDLERQRCALAAFGARWVPETEFNASIRRLGSKSAVLFEVTTEVLRHLLERSAGAPLRVELDRQGGRVRYGPMLAQALQPESMQVLGENPRASAYALRLRGRLVQLHFATDADRSSFPVALASLAAKLARERLMDVWNDWFAARAAGVRPTRGYASDARRWLAEAGPRLRAAGIAPAEVRRMR